MALHLNQSSFETKDFFALLSHGRRHLVNSFPLGLEIGTFDQLP